jgi:endonuclease/exonuclease/phosphatase family metal-dependent hydrolase
MSGVAGNKGAVAIRMDYANTGICFVTAHLAAGFSNYDERNRDYKTISHGLRFSRGRTIDDHDAVIWLGDFNYRIGLTRERVLQAVENNDLQTLRKHDQVSLWDMIITGLCILLTTRVVEYTNGSGPNISILL